MKGRGTAGVPVRRLDWIKAAGESGGSDCEHVKLLISLHLLVQAGICFKHKVPHKELNICLINHEVRCYLR